MPHNDDVELKEILKNSSAPKHRMVAEPEDDGFCGSIAGDCNAKAVVADKLLKGLVQWTTADGKSFVPAAQTQDKITPGVYEIQHSNTIGLYFQRIPVLAQGLLRFPQTNSEKVVTEIQKFWEREALFKEYNLTHKRGIILWGPPGSGKSCTIQLIMRDVVERQGLVIKFTHPSLFIEGMRVFREIEPATPVVILMEDIDSILQHYNESEVLNILDGVNQIERAVFLATTNYPEQLGERIINRPSRFDKRFKIGHPNAESRKMYIEHLIGKDRIHKLNIPIDKWVDDTEDFSLAHLKELFVAVVILGDEYLAAIETLSSMKEDKIDSSQDEPKSPMGFGKVKRQRGYRDFPNT